jgi:hypothetical protein
MGNDGIARHKDPDREYCAETYPDREYYAETKGPHFSPPVTGSLRSPVNIRNKARGPLEVLVDNLFGRWIGDSLYAQRAYQPHVKPHQYTPGISRAVVWL